MQHAFRTTNVYEDVRLCYTHVMRRWSAMTLNYELRIVCKDIHDYGILRYLHVVVRASATSINYDFYVLCTTLVRNDFKLRQPYQWRLGFFLEAFTLSPSVRSPSRSNSLSELFPRCSFCSFGVLPSNV